MTNTSQIIHRGVVERVTPETIEVRISVASSCGACRAKGLCRAAGAGEKQVVVPNRGQAVQAGDEVRVILVSGGELAAVWWGYVCPLALLLVILVLLQAHDCPSVWSGVASIGGVAGYYGVLYAVRNTLKRTFEFEIEKIDL
ncbi:MAG: SoxR reducing system RseC family protein [Prevotellaceae bacterium]|jgi:sigma-E factor negative regulatory protein RseC|nr:SoxR reducing system RseC family protein [Prevotellaceae bacterium]